LLDRSRRSIAVDLKSPEGVELILKMVEQSDALIEGFRAGVTERLGLGPEDCARRNPKLVYGRVTGWGQDGPLAKVAGHDINYISLAGAAHAIGPADAPPPPPLNLVGDFGGGGAYLAIGVLAALLEAQKSGLGQVVDAAMVDGVASLMTAIYGMYAAGVVTNDRGANILDGGAHFYDTYETSDGRYISIASIESKFYAELLELTGFDDPDHKGHRDKAAWPALGKKMAALIKTKSRDEWCEILEGSDICFAPVLDLSEAPRHPHNVARNAFQEIDGVIHPAPAPRFSRTQSKIQKGASAHGADTHAVLADWGFGAAQIKQWESNGVIA
jgi:alpha-methylacyl-CoA racemase